MLAPWLACSALASPCSCAATPRSSSLAASTHPAAVESSALRTALSTTACSAASSCTAPLRTGTGAGMGTGMGTDGGGEGGRSCAASERCTRLSKLESWPRSAALSGEAARARCRASSSSSCARSSSVSITKGTLNSTHCPALASLGGMIRTRVPERSVVMSWTPGSHEAGTAVSMLTHFTTVPGMAPAGSVSRTAGCM